MDTPLQPPAPMRGMRLVLVALVLAVANFMAVLDTAVANVALPNIAGGLGISPSDGTWVITSYSIAEAVSVPLTGWLAARFGPARALVPAMVGFGLFSALCGTASSLGMLVAMRIAQGLCGGPMIPLSQALLRTSFPKEKLGLGLGLWSMTTLIAPVAGPILGGQLSDSAGWQWIFFINVPIAALCAAVAAILLLPGSARGGKAPVDYVGLVLLITWVGATQMMLDNGKDLDWFASPEIRSFAWIAAIGFIAFLIWELTEAHPIVNLRLFRSGAYSAATATLSLTYAAFFSTVVLIPLWLQTDMAYTATWSGYAMASSGLVAMVVAPLVASRLDRWDNRWFVGFGLSVMVIVSILRSRFSTDSDFAQISAYGALQGFGMGFLFAPLNNMALAALSPADAAAGSGLLNFSRTMASAFATSLTVNAWSNSTIVAREGLLHTLAPWNRTTHEALGPLAHGVGPAGAITRLSGIVDEQAVMLATDHMFLISACLFAGALLLSFGRRSRPRRGPIGAAHADEVL